MLDQYYRLELAGQMATGIANGLNKQLTIILTQLDTVLNRIPAHQPVRKELIDVRQNTERCNEVIGSLMAFGRRASTPHRIVDLSATLAEVSRILTLAIPAFIELQVVISTDLSPISADETLLQQVILFLALHGLEAMPEGGILRLEARNFGGSVALTIRDVGHHVPISPRELAAIQRILSEHRALLTEGENGNCFHILFPRAKT